MSQETIGPSMDILATTESNAFQDERIAGVNRRERAATDQARGMNCAQPVVNAPARALGHRE
jgi:hypothetical protein